MGNGGKQALGAAAEQLRGIALSAREGDLIGSEEALIATLGVSRSTVRQVARLLEREGLLRVKRGPYGGYFAARPDARTIETAVSTYLMTLDIEPEDVTLIASALWVEVVRKAAAKPGEETRTVAERLRKQLLAIEPGASLHEVGTVEQDYRDAILALAGSKYVELIFHINTAFALRVGLGEIPPDEAADQSFASVYRDAKLLELSAIAQGDAEVAALAARHARAVWHARVWAVRH